MDKIVQNLLKKANESDPKQGQASLLEAFSLLKSASDSQPRDAPQSIPDHLFVVCAETALKLELRETANASLHIYFSKCPVIDQYACRAYLCQATLLAPATATTFEEVERMAVYIMKCIYSAKENLKWHYLVYNASVLFWQLTRPFMKANFFRCLSPTFVHVVKALDDISDRDYEWRGQLVILLLQSYLDAGDKPNAIFVANKYLPFLKDNAPRQFRELFVLMVRHQLIDIAKLQKDTKLFSALNVTYRLCKLKTAIEESEEVNVASEIANILKMLAAEAEAASGTSQAGGSSLASKRAAEKERSSAKRQGEKADTGGSRGSLKGEWRDQSNRGNILLELARLGIKMHCYDVANDCLVAMQQDSIVSADLKDASVVLGAQLARCEVAAAQLPANYTRTVVEARMKIIERCEELLLNASRIQKPSVVQAGCSTLWNLIQPMLQHELRNQILRPLLLCADQLEVTHSLLNQLRTQVHIELAHCYEQQQQIANALAQLEKAFQLDEDGSQRERIELLRSRLRLRTDLYLVPKRVEEEAAMIIEQLQTAQRHSEKRGAKAAVGGSSQRALLTQAGSVLSPDAFLEVLQGEEEQALISADLIQRIEIMHAKVARHHSTLTKPEGHVRRMGIYNDKERVVLWTDLVKLARKQEVWDIVRVAARFCLCYDDNRWRVPVVQPEVTSKKGKKKTDKKSDQHDDSASQLGQQQAAQLPAPAPAPQEAAAQAPLADGVPPDAAGGQPDGDGTGTETEEAPPAPTFAPKRSGISQFERDLVRMLAETHLIYAESIIQHLLSMNIRYCDEPQKPNWTERQLKLIKIRKSPANNAEPWNSFFEWVRELHQIIASSLARAVQLAVELQESHVITNVCCILWNYGYHLLTEQRHRMLLEQFKMCFDGFRKLNQFPDSVLLVNLTCAIARGYLQPWIPREFLYGFNPMLSSSLKAEDNETKKDHGKRNAPSPQVKKPPGASIPPDAQPDLKEALEACTFVMQLTGGEMSKYVATNRVRQPLLQLWTMLKQFTQQQINRHLGAEDVDNKEGLRPFTRAIVGVEMMWINNNGICELRETPEFKEIIGLIEACDWIGRDERVLELELWARLAFLAFNSMMQPPGQGSTSMLQQYPDIFSKLVQRAIAVFTDRELNRLPADSVETTVVFELLTHCWCLQGRSVMNVAKPSQKTRLQAIKCFAKAAVYAKQAGNYRLVSYAARLFWNSAYPLTSDAVDRRVLRDDLSLILDSFIKTADPKILAEIGDKDQSDQPNAKNDEEDAKKAEQEEEEQMRSVSMFEIQIKSKLGLFFLPLQTPHALVFKLKSDMIEDLSLRTTMAAALFQIYADEGNWEDGIRVLDEAINSMPKTKHRLALIQHRLLVKARLGKSVYVDMQKFKDEDERTLAAMWRRVALCTSDIDMQILAFQRAIETLTSAENEWHKCEYLLEFATCLFNHGFPSKHCARAINWAIDILLNFAVAEQQRARSDLTSSHESAAARKSAPKAPKGQAAETPAVGKGKKGKDDTATAHKGKRNSQAHVQVHGIAATAQSKHGHADAGQAPVTQRSEHTNGSSTPFPVIETNMSPVPMPVHEGDEHTVRKSRHVVFDEIHDVQLLDLLLRAFVQLALLSGPNSPDREANCLQATACVLQTLRVSLAGMHTSLNKSTGKSAGNPGTVAEKAPKQAKGKDGGKDPKDKQTKRKAAGYDGLPSSWSEWATYEITEETLEALRSEHVRKRAPNAATMVQPEMSLYCLRELRDQLRKLGHHQVTLPLLVYESLLVKLFTPELPCYQLLVRLRMLKTCQELNLLSVAAAHDRALPELRISDEDRARSRAEIALWQEKKRRMQATGDAASRNRRKEPNSKDADPTASRVEPRTSTEMLKAPTLRSLWTQIAGALTELGMYQYAREYLYEATVSTDAFSDTMTKREILLQLAKLALLENDCKKARQLAKQAIAADPFDRQPRAPLDTNAARVSSDLLLRAAVISSDSFELDVTRKHPLREAMQEFSSLMAIALEYYNEKRYSNATRAREDQSASDVDLEWTVLQFETKLLDLQLKQSVSYLETSLSAQESFSQCDRRFKSLLLVLDKWRENYEASFEFEPRVAIRMMLRHARLLETVPEYLEQICFVGSKQRAENERAAEEKRLYMSVYSIYRRAVALAQSQLANSMDKFDALIADSAGYCLPIEREFADLRLHYCEFLLKLFRIRAQEIDQEREEKKAKDNLELARDTFLQDEHSHYEMSDDAAVLHAKWLRLSAELPDEIAQTLIEAQSLVRNHKLTVYAKSLALLGACWHVHAQAVSPDSAIQWSFAQLDSEIMKMSAFVRQARENTGVTTAGRETLEAQSSDRSATIIESSEQQTDVDSDTLKWQQRVSEYKHSFENSMNYFRLCTQFLGQAVNICLDSPFASTLFTSACKLASFEMVEVLGQYEPNVAGQFLMLAQSNQFVRHAIDVLTKLQFDTSKSQFSTLLKQMQVLIDNDLCENGTNTPLFETIESTLMKVTDAWPRLRLSKNHLDLTKEFAPNFNFAALQFNDDHSALYAAVFDKPQKTKGAGKPNVALLQNKTTIMKLDNSRRQIDYVLMKVSMHKSNLMRELLRLENKRSQIAERKKLLETVSGSRAGASSDRGSDRFSDRLFNELDSISNAQMNMNPLAQIDDSEFEKQDVHLFYQECEFEFWSLVQELDGLIRPFTKQLEIIHRPLSATTETKSITTSKHEREVSDVHNRNTAAQQPAAPQQAAKEATATDYMVLLCDVQLLDLPLEALSVFQHAEGICSVSRDFSLQLHYRRSHVFDLTPDQKTALPVEEKERSKKQSVSRIPALRDAAKTKQGKAQYLDRQVPPWCTSIDINNFRYIVDPHNECDAHKFAPIAQFQKALQREQGCTTRWIGLLGSDHVPSLAEYEVYWKESSSFIFYGVERLQYDISFSRIASLSVPDCSVAAFFDLVQTVKSNLRVAKSDIEKQPIELIYEADPVLRAILVSLSGVSCVLTNQWYTTLQDNAEKLQISMRTLCTLGKSTGEACRILQTAARKGQLSVVMPVGSASSGSQLQQAAGQNQSQSLAAGSQAPNAPQLSTVESVPVPASGASNPPPDRDRDSVNLTVRSASAVEQQSLTSGQSEFSAAKREWYNLVCYGLPNLITNNI